jgi:hypothetical protein
MKKAPQLWQLKDLLKTADETQAHIGGLWVPARPIGYFSLRSRLKMAWLVFKGEADALQWPQGQ